MSWNHRAAVLSLWSLAPMLLGLAAPVDPNRAPAEVFIVLGVARVVLVIVLLLTIPLSGEDFRQSGTQYYGGPFGGLGGFGGFGGFGGP